MNIPIKLQMLIDDILTLRHTDEEWLELEKEANEYFKELSTEELNYFSDSGAGEALYMSCSGIRFERQSNN